MKCENKKFFVCEICGNLVGMIHDSGVPVVCCGQDMTLLEANTQDAPREKHVPVITQSGSTVKVEIGSAPHPMAAEHYIMWVFIQTAQGGQRKCLEPGQAPSVEFALAPEDTLEAVFAYCNIHGLWKAEA